MQSNLTICIKERPRDTKEEIKKTYFKCHYPIGVRVLCYSCCGLHSSPHIHSMGVLVDDRALRSSECSSGIAYPLPPLLFLERRAQESLSHCQEGSTWALRRAGWACSLKFRSPWGHTSATVSPALSSMRLEGT